MSASLNPYITKFGEEFDAGKSSQYRLTIQFALGGLSYALLDSATQTMLAVECYQSDLLADSDDLFRTLERALEAKGLNNKEFLSVSCLIDERISTLVPDALFNEADKSKYLEFAFLVPGNYAVQSVKLKTVPCHNVFAWPKALRDKVSAKWKEADITHSSALFVDSVMYVEGQKPTVFVNVRNRDFDMVVVKDGQLSFFNNFRFNTKDDFAYFLLLAMEQNGLSGQDTPVCFSGLIRPASEIFDLCGRYVRDIRFVEDPNALHVSPALEEVPFQYYFIHYQALR